MDPDRPMYQWRRMTPEQRQEALADRQRHRRPWHAPPHSESDTGIYLVTAACFEHHPIIGLGPTRLATFEADLLETVTAHADRTWAWVVLPNHYNFLAHAPDLAGLLAGLGVTWPDVPPGTGGELPGPPGVVPGSGTTVKLSDTSYLEHVLQRYRYGQQDSRIQTQPTIWPGRPGRAGDGGRSTRCSASGRIGTRRVDRGAEYRL